MAGGQETLGGDEIMVILTNPSSIDLYLPFTITGTLYGSVKSQQIQMKVYGDVVQTVPYRNDSFSFTYTLEEMEDIVCPIEISGLLNGEVQSVETLNIRIANPPFAQSLAIIYNSLVDVLEDNFNESIRVYDPISKEGEGLTSVIHRIREL